MVSKSFCPSILIIIFGSKFFIEDKNNPRDWFNFLPDEQALIISKLISGYFSSNNFNNCPLMLDS